MASRLLNAAVVAFAAAWFALRAPDVGGVEAIAEMLGVAHLPAYIRWRDSYHPLHSELLQGVLHMDWLDAALAAALANATDRPQALLALVRREGAGVFSLPLLSPRFCRLLSEEVAHFLASGHTSPLPNSMNEYGVVLEELGMGQVMAQLREQVLSPLAAALYGRPLSEAQLAPDPEDAAVEAAVEEAGASSCCSEHHAFTVRYSPSEQPGGWTCTMMTRMSHSTCVWPQTRAPRAPA